MMGVWKAMPKPTPVRIWKPIHSPASVFWSKLKMNPHPTAVMTEPATMKGAKKPKRVISPPIMMVQIA